MIEQVATIPLDQCQTILEIFDAQLTYKRLQIVVEEDFINISNASNINLEVIRFVLDDLKKRQCFDKCAGGYRNWHIIKGDGLAEFKNGGGYLSTKVIVLATLNKMKEGNGFWPIDSIFFEIGVPDDDILRTHIRDFLLDNKLTRKGHYEWSQQLTIAGRELTGNTYENYLEKMERNNFGISIGGGNSNSVIVVGDGNTVIQKESKEEIIKNLNQIFETLSQSHTEERILVSQALEMLQSKNEVDYGTIGKIIALCANIATITDLGLSLAVAVWGK